jgi:hypothetical protein
VKAPAPSGRVTVHWAPADFVTMIDAQRAQIAAIAFQRQ